MINLLSKLRASFSKLNNNIADFITHALVRLLRSDNGKTNLDLILYFHILLFALIITLTILATPKILGFVITLYLFWYLVDFVQYYNTVAAQVFTLYLKDLKSQNLKDELLN